MLVVRARARPKRSANQPKAMPPTAAERSVTDIMAPLKAAAEKQGKLDFTNLWAGQAVRLGRDMPAAELTRVLAGSALARLSKMAG